MKIYITYWICTDCGTRTEVRSGVRCKAMHCEHCHAGMREFGAFDSSRSQPWRPDIIISARGRA